MKNYEEKAWRLVMSRRFSYTEMKAMTFDEIDRANGALNYFKNKYDDYY